MLGGGKKRGAFPFATAAVFVALFIELCSFSAIAAGSKKTTCVELLRPGTHYEVIRSETAHEQAAKIKEADLRQQYLNDQKPKATVSYGHTAPIVHSFEKEGLDYEDIAYWFPALRPEAKTKLRQQFEKEKSLPGRQKKFTRWLTSLKNLDEPPPELQGEKWQSKSAAQKLKILLSLEDPFSVLTIDHRAWLFENDILKFDDIEAGPNAPPFMDVGDDDGSYEVRMSRGVADRAEYHRLRQQAEEYLEGRVGHQHLFHAWPKDPKLREKMAPQYIELLDATTWYLFWRQMKRDPENVSSILTHPYLGVYTRASLERLHRAVVANEPQHFKDKFRMVGARAFRASADIPEQGKGYIPDWELRSGNKGLKREFVETMLEARLSTGDYSGLKDFRKSKFDPSFTIEKIATPFLTEGQIRILERFQALHPALRYNSHVLSTNHIRNRIISPLLPWHERIPMVLKEELLKEEQEKYALGLVRIAKKFIKRLEAGRPFSSVALGELRADTIEEIEDLIFKFSSRVRLDLDFERYLQIVPAKVPELTVPSDGPIDVNQIPIGIEYSHRFPIEAKPKSRRQAEEYIQKLANRMRAFFSSPTLIESKTSDSHGHGMVVKYVATDASGDEWRVEWDGISRYYVAGKVRRAWGGHAEVPTPKFNPQTIDDGIRQMFQAARSLGMYPTRRAGGGHFNVDLEMLMKELPPEKGARAVANVMSYFESNQELILFMWMHPRRKHAAHPIVLHPEFADRLTAFHGDWEDLGRLLYESRYFNTFVGRKPKYVALNMTALMTPILPDAYTTKSLDIRNPQSSWFPSFGRVEGRFEARFFDAPVDEVMAALQIKYFRALLNRALNFPGAVPLQKRFSSADIERWRADPQAWLAEAGAHLSELGLNAEEFKWLLWDSYLNRINYEERQHDYEVFDGYLPAKVKRLKKQSSRLFLLPEIFGRVA